MRATFFVCARTLGGANRSGVEFAGIGRAHVAGIRHDPRGEHLRLCSASHTRAGPRRWIHPTLCRIARTWALTRCNVLTIELVDDANAQPGLGRVYTTFRAGVPQLFADVDRVKAKTLDVPLSNVFGTLQTFLGSTYVNDFNKFGRTYQVKVQAEPAFRATPDDIKRLEVRSSQGRMVPLGTLVGECASRWGRSP